MLRRSSVRSWQGGLWPLYSQKNVGIRHEDSLFILVGFDTPKLASALLQKRQSSTFWNASQLAARIVYFGRGTAEGFCREPSGQREAQRRWRGLRTPCH